MKNKFSILVFLFLSFCWISCGGNKEELSMEERYTVDTIYQNNINKLRERADALCISVKDSLYHVAVDSIQAEYMHELELMLAKRISE